MKRVVLLGDSIRMGYLPTVRADLAGVVHVISPTENGQHTVNELLHLQEWAICHQPDVVHINAGLWDMRRVVRGVAENVIPPAVYQQNVATILRLLREHTQAKLIWATTTPIHHGNANLTHDRAGYAGRDASEIARYNQLAIEAAKAQDATINDLHATVISAGIDKVLASDGVHFTPEGYEMLGHQVSKAIRSAIAPAGSL
jgi:lysophospholipase L1-like esterase